MIENFIGRGRERQRATGRRNWALALKGLKEEILLH
jgi:hypothetical protein